MRRNWIGLVVGVALIWIGSRALLAEDFTVEIDQLAETDSKRPLPEYRLGREESKDEGGVVNKDMPSRNFRISIRFKKFGDVFLDSECEERPLKDNPEARVRGSGLCDLESVKIGWIKDSPDLLMAGWVVEHGRGNNPTPDHGMAILQLKDGKARVLARRVEPCGMRVSYMEQGEPMEDRRFSWDPKSERLVERISVWRIVARSEAGPLLRAGKLGEEEKACFITDLYETITVEYRIKEGKLVATGGAMSYQTKEKVDLGEVADFYLAGPTRQGEPEKKPFKDHASAVQAILKANSKLAERFKGMQAAGPMELKEDDEVMIPFEQERVLREYAPQRVVEGG